MISASSSCPISAPRLLFSRELHEGYANFIYFTVVLKSLGAMLVLYLTESAILVSVNSF